MAVSLYSKTRALPSGWAFGIVLALWAVYTVMEALAQSGRLPPLEGLLLELIPGLLGVAALGLNGMTRGDCFLRWGRISRPGLIVQGIAFVLLLGVPFSGGWIGWDPVRALVYAPLGVITQELYFRAALLPALIRQTGGRTWLALVLHTLLFGLWHTGPLVNGYPLAGIVLVMTVPMFAGLAWGWQAQRDRTIVWGLFFHGIILFLNAFFTPV